jgi:hypothetical protein
MKLIRFGNPGAEKPWAVRHKTTGHAEDQHPVCFWHEAADPGCLLSGHYLG